MLTKLFRRKQEPKRVRLTSARGSAAATEFEATDKQTILDAALEQGVEFPHNCRVGGCATCKCRLVEGKVKERTDSSYVLGAEELQAGYVLACQSLPKGDVVLELPGWDKGRGIDGAPARGAGRPHHPIVGTPATVAGLRPLTHDILELTLALEEPIAYTAGQYAELHVPGITDAPRSYSFAAPTGPDGATAQPVFHVRRVPGGQFTEWLHGSAAPGARLELKGPYGNFWLRPAGAPILAVAGGSGLAPVKALLEQAAADGVDREVIVCFGARSRADLYAVDAMAALAARWPAPFRFLPVLSEEPADSDWEGARGLITDELARRAEGGLDLAAHDAYMCGPPPMLDAAEALLRDAGLPTNRIHADRFLDRRHTAAAA